MATRIHHAGNPPLPTPQAFTFFEIIDRVSCVGCLVWAVRDQVTLWSTTLGCTLVHGCDMGCKQCKGMSQTYGSGQLSVVMRFLWISLLYCCIVKVACINSYQCDLQGTHIHTCMHTHTPQTPHINTHHTHHTHHTRTPHTLCRHIFTLRVTFKHTTGDRQAPQTS